MSEFSFELPNLVAATLTLSLSAMIAWIGLNWFKPQGHRLYRLVWMAVLLQGIMLAKVSVELPVLDAESTQSISSLFGNPFPVPATIEKPTCESTGDRNIERPETEASVQIENQVVPRDQTPANEYSTESGKTGILIDMGVWMTRIWCCGILFCFGYMLFHYLRVLSVSRCSSMAPPEWSGQCDGVCNESGLNSAIPLLVHEQIGPALVLTPIGYRIIVPPSFWSELSYSQRSAVLRHEIEHYRRSDVIVSFLARIVAAVHWFNPFAWIAVRQLDAAAEWACDDAAAIRGTMSSEFARALLSISTGNTRHLVGANGMGSSNLKIRIQRLLNGARKTSRFGNMALTTLAMFILISGWINLRLIAESAIANATRYTQSDDLQLEKNISELASQLANDGDASQRLRKLFASPAGKIAVANSVADVENQLRTEATKDVIPDFFETEVVGNFHQVVAREAAEAHFHIKKLDQALEGFKNELVGTTNADKMFRRFLEMTNAGTVLYFGELRKQIKPDQQMLMRHLGRFLAQNSDGKLIVRESAKAPLAEKLEALKDTEDHISFLKEELALLGKELTSSDELHEKCRSRLMKGKGAPFVIALAFNEPSNLGDRVNRYLGEVDSFFEDGPEGLTIAQETRDQLTAGMKEMDRLVNNMERMKGPVLSIVNKIDVTAGGMEKKVKNFLSSDVGIAVLSMQVDLEDSDPGAIAKRIKAEVLEETEKGLKVRTDRQEEIIEFSRRMLKGGRDLRRQLRVVDSRVNGIPKIKIGPLLDSVESKLILVEKIKNHTQQMQFDAWPVWLDSHFELIEGKYRLKPEFEELVDHLFEEAKAIEKELSNDDF